VLGAEGTVVAAISVSGPIERLTRHPGKRYGQAVVDAARTLRP
jgi:DNA-binding IclR family transcriptional regulator